MTDAPSGADGRRALRGDGIVQFVLALVARSFLVFTGSLATIALLPALLGWNATVVQSGSMEPGISPGDVVLTSSLPDDADVPLGRVVAFDSPAEAEPDGVAKIRLHRIVDATGDGEFITAGDANADVDSTPIVRSQIIGQARLLVPWVGLPGWWIGTGQFASLAAWVTMTLAALVLVALEAPRASRARASVAPSVAPPVVSPVPADGLARRGFLSGVGGLVVFGLVAVPRQSADAAFTARTSSAGNTWSVASVAPITPGRAAAFLLLASSSITNVNSHGATWIDGSIATSPGTTVTGFSSWNLSGAIHRDSVAARNARTDALALAAAVDKRAATASLPATVTGTFRPGVYSTTTAVTGSGVITLDARGDSSALFVFRAASVSMAGSSIIRLVNGAKATNVYWRSSNGLTVARDAVAVGTLIAGTTAALAHGSTLTGRAIALGGGISIDRATVQAA